MRPPPLHLSPPTLCTHTLGSVRAKIHWFQISHYTHVHHVYTNARSILYTCTFMLRRKKKTVNYCSGIYILYIYYNIQPRRPTATPTPTFSMVADSAHYEIVLYSGCTCVCVCRVRVYNMYGVCVYAIFMYTFTMIMWWFLAFRMKRNKLKNRLK